MASITYVVRSPWKWVFEEAFQKYHCCDYKVKEVSSPRELPSREVVTATKRKKCDDRRRKSPQGCTLRMEITKHNNDNNSGNDNEYIGLFYGLSRAMDGLAYKDTFADTLRKLDCEYIAPPTKLIEWDASKEIVMNLEYPEFLDDKDENEVVILKTPLGSRGEGVFFIRRKRDDDAGKEEIYTKYVRDNYERAKKETELLSILKEKMGHIPRWVLQSEIPSMLINRKKFHLRTYILVVEKSHNGNNDEGDVELEVYYYNRHEVRLASIEIPLAKEKDNDDDIDAIRNRKAHITNGASSNETHRCLMSQIPELTSNNNINYQEKLEEFVKCVFGTYLLSDMTQRAKAAATATRDNEYNDLIIGESLPPTKLFAFAGVDIMIDKDGRFYIIEVNVNPACPPKDVLGDENAFTDHLVGLANDFIDFFLHDDKQTNFIPIAS